MAINRLHAVISNQGELNRTFRNKKGKRECRKVRRFWSCSVMGISVPAVQHTSRYQDSACSNPQKGSHQAGFGTGEQVN